MSVWALAFVLFLGFAGWGAGFVEVGSLGGGTEDGVVTAMEDPIGPPPPKP